MLITNIQVFIRLDFSPIGLTLSIYIAYLFKNYPNDLLDSYNLKLIDDNLFKLPLSFLKEKSNYKMNWLDNTNENISKDNNINMYKKKRSINNDIENDLGN